MDANIFNDISPKCIIHTFFSMAKGGIKCYAQKIGIIMYQFGSAAGPACFPLYINKKNKNGVSMLPIPVTKCRPGELE